MSDAADHDDFQYWNGPVLGDRRNFQCEECGMDFVDGKPATLGIRCDTCGTPCCGWCGGEGGLDGRACQSCGEERDPYGYEQLDDYEDRDERELGGEG